MNLDITFKLSLCENWNIPHIDININLVARGFISQRISCYYQWTSNTHLNINVLLIFQVDISITSDFIFHIKTSSLFKFQKTLALQNFLSNEMFLRFLQIFWKKTVLKKFTIISKYILSDFTILCKYQNLILFSKSFISEI